MPSGFPSMSVIKGKVRASSRREDGLVLDSVEALVREFVQEICTDGHSPCIVFMLGIRQYLDA